MDTQKSGNSMCNKKIRARRTFGAAFVRARMSSEASNPFWPRNPIFCTPCARARRSGSIAHQKEFDSKYQHSLINMIWLHVLGDVGWPFVPIFCISSASLWDTISHSYFLHFGHTLAHCEALFKENTNLLTNIIYLTYT